jgi:hypothetical protein
MSALLLTSFLSSGCQTIPEKLVVTQKFIDLELVTVNGEILVDPDLSFCLVREYEFSPDRIAPIEKFQKFPLAECNKVNGYSPRDYTAVWEYLDAIRNEIQEHQHGT